MLRSALRWFALCLWLNSSDQSDLLAQSPELDLGARVQPLSEANRFSIPGFHVWCGAPVKGPDGKYHLYYSRWPQSAGFAPAWALQSEIAYATAERPEGPYRHVNIALPKRGINPASGKKYWDADVSHNPSVFCHNGKFYLYYVGQFGDGKNYPKHRNRQRIGVAIADTPEGPWMRMDSPVIDISSNKSDFDSLCVTNPAACIRPDGSVLLIYKAVQFLDGKELGGNVRYGVAIAEKPEGPFQKHPGRIFEADESQQHWMLAEDPYVWFSEKYGQKYYAIARDVVGTFTGSKGAICLFESVDGFTWKISKHPKVLENRFRCEGGTLSEKQLERPALLIEDGEPIYLFGATDGYSNTKASSNVHFELSNP